MLDKKTETIIIKFLNRSLNSKDLDYLKQWILDPINESLFEDYIRSHFEITIGMNESDADSIKEKLFNEIRKEKSLLYRLNSNPFYRLGVAALIVLLLSLPFIIKTSNPDIENATDIVEERIEPGTDKATLTLEDGSVIALEKGKSIQTQNANSNGEELIYKNSKAKAKKIVYNYLTVPRGGQHFVKLADGTKVWLNSESKLKYPTTFIDGKDRMVELVYGEAYFEVSPSTRHNGSKFKLLNRSQEIEVIGTEFNVKAYRDEYNIYTTLVEGEVAVDNGNIVQHLTPNQQLNFDIDTGQTMVSVVEVYNEVSWKDGIFSFDGKPLKDIMKVLSRWYDMDVVFINKDVEEEEFAGILRKNQSIENVLLNIKNFGIIKNYEINEKTVILK